MVSFLFGVIVGILLGGVGLFLLRSGQEKAEALRKLEARYYVCEVCGTRLLKKSRFNHLRSRKHRRHTAELRQLLNNPISSDDDDDVIERTPIVCVKNEYDSDSKMAEEVERPVSTRRSSTRRVLSGAERTAISALAKLMGE